MRRASDDGSSELPMEDGETLIGVAIADIVRQLGRTAVTQDETQVREAGAFDMAEVIKAIMDAFLDDHGHAFDAVVDALALPSHRPDTELEDKDFLRFTTSQRMPFNACAQR